VLVAGRTLRAGSTRGVAPEGATRKAADAALKAQAQRGPDAILSTSSTAWATCEAGEDDGRAQRRRWGATGDGLIVLGVLARGGGGLCSRAGAATARGGG
jgi:hypothetical protein